MMVVRDVVGANMRWRVGMIGECVMRKHKYLICRDKKKHICTDIEMDSNATSRVKTLASLNACMSTAVLTRVSTPASPLNEGEVFTSSRWGCRSESNIISNPSISSRLFTLKR